MRAEKLYVIRSVRTKDGKPFKTEYYMTPAMWTKNPIDATIFCDYDAGTAHLNLFRTRDWGPDTKWQDGAVEEFDVVPLYGEIIQSPNATHIEIKK